jgi:hypothetical protein
MTEGTQYTDDIYEDSLFDQLRLAVLDRFCITLTLMLGAASVVIPYLHNYTHLLLSTQAFLQLIWLPSLPILGILEVVEGSRHKDNIGGVVRLMIGLVLILSMLFILVSIVNGALAYTQVPQVPYTPHIPPGYQGPTSAVA